MEVALVVEERELARASGEGVGMGVVVGEEV